MGLFPKPDQESIRRLALDETDPAEARRFAPLRFGFAGNALIIVISGAAGLICSAVMSLWSAAGGRIRHG